MSEDDENAEYDVGSEEVFPLNPDSADLCAIARTKSPKSSQGENMPPGGIIVITAGPCLHFRGSSSYPALPLTLLYETN